MRRNKNPEANHDKAMCLEIGEEKSACAAVGAREGRFRFRDLGRLSRIPMIACLALLFLGTAAHAGFKLVDADGNEKIDLGFRLQVLAISSEHDTDGDGNYEAYDDFWLRRARFRLKGTLNEHFSIFLQTDLADRGVDVIDAYVHLQKSPQLQVFFGRHLPPSSRQTTTSDDTLLAMDRPGASYKPLTWGGKGVRTFGTETYNESVSGVGGRGVQEGPLRDDGVTAFGVRDFGDSVHLKYYLGVYDGWPDRLHDEERYAGRLQLNLGDAEPGYYSSANHLGEKRTFAIGASYDTQSDVDFFNKPSADYRYWSVDLFAEQPLAGGSLTFEAAYHDMDLGGAIAESEGEGFYFQTGYLIQKKKWQPWFLYEEWAADAASGHGSFDLWRAGISYFMEGHNANFKVGYERFQAGANIQMSNEDTVGSLVFGLYATY